MNHRNLIQAAVAVLCAGAASASMAALVSGGATLPQNLYTDVRVQKDTQAAGGTNLFSYVGVGSGAGKNAFFNNDQWYLNGNTSHASPVHFVGSDSVISATELSNYNAGTVAATAGKLIQVPAVATSVAVAFNKAGVSSLNLTSAQLCGVFGGSITNWNQISSASGPINVVFRSESSGTTELFTRHLEAVCGSSVFTTSTTFTTAHVGAEPSNWVGAAGNPGVRAAIDAADGTIGYVSPDFIQSKPVAGLYNKNESGAPARLPAGNGDVSLALSAALLAPTGANRTDPTKWVPVVSNPSQGYPIVGTTNLILSQCYNAAADLGNATLVLREFFDRFHARYAAVKTAIGDHQFIALPDAFVDAATATFLGTGDGQSLQIGLSTQAQCGGKGR
ncbi:substrate-binding domain-containing protein [Cupriavidus sp. USMAA2-4]|uniref:substrate-binding domain-containing protein n=1 Tax=Cupriavidus sp. USMAA2-4 TaxID=876364 RepID=UPI0018DDE23B|nr:substrate-binding domain-containing protein [Cupriavidus sp. USMAA2-4]